MKFKLRRVPIFLILIILFSMCIILILKEIQVKQQPPVKNITVLIRDALNENWENFKQGAEQAGKDLNAELHFVSLSKNGSNKTAEQIELLNHENMLATDALVIAPANYDLLVKPLENLKKTIPIVLVESKINSSQDFQAVTFDNELMGQSLAEEVMRHGNMRKRVLLLDGGVQCGSVIERKESFRKTLQSESYNQLIDWSTEKLNEKTILDYLLTEKIDVIAAMDTEVLEEAAKALIEYENYQRINKIELYGVGSGNGVISYLEDSYITSTVIQDDFSMGYLGVKDAIYAVNKKSAEKGEQISFTIVDREHMYSEENQRLLFPFVW